MMPGRAAEGSVKSNNIDFQELPDDDLIGRIRQEALVSQNFKHHQRINGEERCMAFLVCRIEKLNVAVKVVEKDPVGADYAIYKVPFPCRADGDDHKECGNRQRHPGVERRICAEDADAENYKSGQEDHRIDYEPYFSPEIGTVDFYDCGNGSGFDDSYDREEKNA